MRRTRAKRTRVLLCASGNWIPHWPNARCAAARQDKQKHVRTMTCTHRRTHMRTSHANNTSHANPPCSHKDHKCRARHRNARTHVHVKAHKRTNAQTHKRTNAHTHTDVPHATALARIPRNPNALNWNSRPRTPATSLPLQAKLSDTQHWKARRSSEADSTQRTPENKHPTQLLPRREWSETRPPIGWPTRRVGRHLAP